MKWAQDDIDGYLNFYSISEDGIVSHWTLVKSSMCHSEILSIPLSKALNNATQETKSKLKGKGYLVKIVANLILG